MTDPFGLSPSLTFENFNSTVPFAPSAPAPPAPPPPTAAQQQQVQARFEELLKNDQLLRDCAGNPYCTMFRRQELLQQARMDVLGQNAPPPSAGEIFSELVLALSYLLNGLSGAGGGPGGPFGPTQ